MVIYSFFIEIIANPNDTIDPINRRNIFTHVDITWVINSLAIFGLETKVLKDIVNVGNPVNAYTTAAKANIIPIVANILDNFMLSPPFYYLLRQ